MNNQKLIEDIQNREIDFLEKATGKGFVCPLCGNGSRTGKGKSHDGIILNNKVGGKYSYKCFSCGVSGDTLDWWLYLNDLKQPDKQADSKDFIKGLLNCAKYYNLNVEDYQETIPHTQLKPIQRTDPPKQPEPQPQPKDSFVITHIEDTTAEEFIKGRDYLNSRCITLKTAQRNDVCISDVKDIKSDNSFIAITQENISRGHTIRGINGKQKYNNGNTDLSFFFNGKEDPAKYIFIAEGMFDSLSLAEIGFDSICLNSLNNLNKLYEYLNQHKTEYLYKSLIVCLDNDSAGLTATETFKKKLFDLNLDIRYINLCADTDHKDLNDYMKFDSNGLIKVLSDTVKTVETELIENNKDTFLYWWNNRAEEEKRLKNKRYATGLYDLDNIIGGGLPVGLTVLGALSSLGKTTLLSQIGEHIASNDINVLFFSLEQGQIDIFKKGLYRNLFLTHHKELQAEDKQNLDSYYKKIKHYYNVISGDFTTTIKTIDSKIQQIKNYSDNDIVVIIDYLQALKPMDEKGRVIVNYFDKQATDNLIQSLKILSKNYNIPVLTISSIGRTNYFNKMEIDSFKESGNIEYTADVLLGMDLNAVRYKDFKNKPEQEKAEVKNIINEEYKKNERDITITVLKNRNGKARETAELKFFPAWSVFTDKNYNEEEEY